MTKPRCMIMKINAPASSHRNSRDFPSSSQTVEIHPSGSAQYFGFCLACNQMMIMSLPGDSHNRRIANLTSSACDRYLQGWKQIGLLRRQSPHSARSADAHRISGCCTQHLGYLTIATPRETSQPERKAPPPTLLTGEMQRSWGIGRCIPLLDEKTVTEQKESKLKAHKMSGVIPLHGYLAVSFFQETRDTVL